MTPPVTLARVWDKLIDHFIVPHCRRPTFVTHQPECLSPLAKSDPQRPGLTERFELFVNGDEMCNAYSELADPEEQRRRFAHQTSAREGGDDEAHPEDWSFVGKTHQLTLIFFSSINLSRGLVPWFTAHCRLGNGHRSRRCTLGRSQACSLSHLVSSNASHFA